MDMTNIYLTIAGFSLVVLVVATDMIANPPGSRRRHSPAAVRHTRRHDYKLPPRG